jgi:hypothetical protein
MRTDSKIEQWREQNAPRLISGMVVLVNVLVLLRAFGLLTNVGPSTEFLGGLCVGSWIGLAVFHLSGGALPMRQLSKVSANAGAEHVLNAAGPRPTPGDRCGAKRVIDLGEMRPAAELGVMLQNPIHGARKWTLINWPLIDCRFLGRSSSWSAPQPWMRRNEQAVWMWPSCVAPRWKPE